MIEKKKSQKLAGVAVQARISLFNSPTYGTFSRGRSHFAANTMFPPQMFTVVSIHVTAPLESLPGQIIGLPGNRDKVNKSGTVPEIAGQLVPM